MNSPKKWSTNEDEALADWHKRGRSLPAMAERFATTQEDVIERLKHLKENPPGVAPKSVDITPKEEEKPTNEGMDAIDLLTNQAAQAYNNLVAVLGTKQSRDQILGGAVQAEAFWRQLKPEGRMPLHLFVAQVLHENYIMIPRPQILPAPTITTTVQTSSQHAQHPNPPGR